MSASSRTPEIVLASASPRRAELLTRAGVAFRVMPAQIDESLEGGVAPEAAACALAERKARAVVVRLSDRDAFVLGADTIVAVDRASGAELLGKPDDARDARRMLAVLSGSRHRVVTGVCAVRAKDGALASGFERTFVTMRALTPREIDDYVASEEWRDKAGGYAIQESADRFVTRLEEGGYDNVVGLPVALALDLLARVGAPCGAR
jgi:septum formation protein